MLALWIQSPIDALLNVEALRGATISVCVETTDGRPVYAFNSESKLIPASNQKLLTALYALETKSPDFTYKTKFWKLDGKIFVEAAGDPTIAEAKFAAIRKKLYNSGDHPVCLKESYRPGFYDTWEKGNLANRFSAPITALSVDRGGFELWCQKGRLELRPRNYGIRIQRRAGSKFHVSYDPLRPRLVVTGPIPSGEKCLDTLSLPEPDFAAASILGSRCRLVDSLPNLEPSEILESAHLKDIVKQCLTESDNNYAEHLMFLASGATELDGARASFAKFLLDGPGLGAERVKPMDGSGLSRKNLISAQGIVKALQWARTRPYFQIFFDSLAAGGAGTLENRLKGSTFHGKTGTLDSVSALSGFVKSKGGVDYVASIIINNFSVESSVVRGIQDQIIGNLENDSGNGTQIEGYGKREVALSHSSSRPPDDYRFHRPGGNGNFARAGSHR